MKNIIIGFIIGMSFILSIAATIPDSFMTIKPATPKMTKVYHGLYPQEFIVKYANLDYVVVSTMANNSFSTVVMCKY